MTVDQVLLQAEALVREGDLDRARKLYQAVLGVAPGEERAKTALAKLADSETPDAATDDPPQETLEGLVALYNQGQFAAVAEQADQLTMQFPDAFILWNILGASSAQSRQLALAEKAFRRAAELSDGHPEPLNNLANALKEQGKLDDAVDAYQRALKAKPDYVLAQSNLGVCLQEQGRIGEAVAAYRKALSHKPDYVDAHNFLGVALQQQGRLVEAVSSYRQALSIAPDYVDALNNLGNAYRDMKQLDEAISTYRKALHIRPNYIKSHNNLGVALKELGKLDDALAAYRQALSLDPDYTEALSNLGSVLQAQGKSEEAITAYRKALVSDPEYIDAQINLGNVFQEQGEFDKAVEAYKGALAIDPTNAEVYRGLSKLRKFQPGDPEAAQMNEQYDRDSLSDEDRCQLCFALAKVHDDLGEPGVAFTYLSEGNKLRKSDLGYDIEKDRAYFASIRDADTGACEKSLPSSPETTRPAPIFILGMPRSGTTLVEQIISAHSAVSGGGELPFADRFGARMSTGEHPRSHENLKKFRESYLGEIAKLGDGRPFVTDKFPQNFLHIGVICNALPEARIVHVKRDPAAICWSNYWQFFTDRGFGFCYDLKDVVAYYHLYEDLMDFWSERYADRIYHLDYEALTTNQDRETRNLVSHLGLPWNDACLAPQDNRRGVNTASQWQVRQPVYTGSSQKWRTYEPFLNGAFDELAD